MHNAFGKSRRARGVHDKKQVIIRPIDLGLTRRLRSGQGFKIFGKFRLRRVA